MVSCTVGWRPKRELTGVAGSILDGSSTRVSSMPVIPFVLSTRTIVVVIHLRDEG
jgi:hypothetical protein